MERIFMNTENSKTNEPHRFTLDRTDKFNLKNPKKNMALANLKYLLHLEKYKISINFKYFRFTLFYYRYSGLF